MPIKNLITFMQNSNIIRKKLYSDSTGTHYAVDQYIDTHPRDPNYDSRRDTVFNWISNLKAKRRIN